MAQSNPNPKPNLSPVPVWRCKNNGCKAWIRVELSTDPDPSCPMCKGTMMKSIKHLPELVNKIKKGKNPTSK